MVNIEHDLLRLIGARGLGLHETESLGICGRCIGRMSLHDGARTRTGGRLLNENLIFVKIEISYSCCICAKVKMNLTPSNPN